MYWYWFTATKNGEERRERIPAESEESAIKELNQLGYESVKIFDAQPIYKHHTYAAAF